MADEKDDAGQRESERRLAMATHAARIGIWDWDLSDNSFVYSDLAKDIFGLPRDEPVTYEAVIAVTHPDDYPWTSAMARRAVDPALRENEPYRYRVRRADTGEERWILAHGEATFEVVNGVERAARYTGTVQDITEQKRAEDALIESEARLQLAVAAGRMAVWELDLERQEITHSSQLNVLFGFPPDARPTLDDFRSRYAPGERERVEAEGREMQQRGGREIQTEFKQVWPDGTEKWLMMRAAIAPTSSGPGRRVIGVLMDITDRRRAEERTRTIAAELQHRMRNSLTVVQTIASQTFRDRDTAALETFLGRIRALATASDIINLNDVSSTGISNVIDEITRPFRDAADDRFIISGDRLHLPSKAAIGLGMALHELCTNAVKYGALSVPDGRVVINWRQGDGTLELHWREQDGPPVVAPRRKGFGTLLLERGAFAEADGSILITYAPTGLTAQISIRT